jgi:hypothetical protein
VLVQIYASDVEDAAGTLKVEVSIDGGVSWNTAVSTYGTLYDYSWTTPAGEDGVVHTLVARATDESANVTTSESILATVDNVGTTRVASAAQKVEGQEVGDRALAELSERDLETIRDVSAVIGRISPLF